MSDGATIKLGAVPETRRNLSSNLPVAIADHELLRLIGRGTFGEVWLAQSNATGRYRAVKVVYRDRVPTAHSYEIEFAGLKRFEEVAREHLGFVDILHISRHEEAGYFYYVMELADAEEGGARISPDTYACRTLSTLLAAKGRLPLVECARLVVVVAEAVAELHRHNLVHRDIKPGNIVFVRGSPKLADVGLVSDASDAMAFTSIIGTPGYLDEAAHGTPAGDIYALGKILYVMASGRPAKDWPNWPEDAANSLGVEDIKELDRIVRKACHSDHSRRYTDVQQFLADLRPLLVSAQVRRLQRFAGLISFAKRYAMLAAVLLGLAALAGCQWMRWTRQAADLRQREVGVCISQGNRAMEAGNALGSLPWLVRALEIDAPNPDRTSAHRLRLGCALGQTPSLKLLWFSEREQGQPVFAGQENRLLAPLPGGFWACVALPTRATVSPPIGCGDSNETAAITRMADLAVTCSGRSNSVSLWNLNTGQKLQTFTCATNLHAAAISPDGRWIAAAAEDWSVLLWEVARPATPRLLAGHQGRILCLRFNRDGLRLASGGEDSLLILWDVQTGESLGTNASHGSWVYQVAFSPDDRELATASFDRKARILDSRTGVELAPPLSHGDGVYSVDWSPDGTLVATACLGFEVRIWKRKGGQLLWVLPHETRPVHVTFDPSGGSLLTLTHDGTMRVWNLRSVLQPVDLTVGGWSAAGHRVLQRREDGVRLVGVAGRWSSALVPMPSRQILKALLDEQGQRLLLVTRAGATDSINTVEARLWDTQLDEPCGPAIPLRLPLPEMVLSPGGRRLALLATNSTLVLDLTSGQQVFGINEGLTLASFDGAERRLAGAISNRVCVWKLASRAPPRVLSNTMGVGFLAWSHHGQYLVTTCWDSSFRAEAARVWNAGTGHSIGKPLWHRDGVRSAAFSPDDTRIVTCGEDFNALLWDVRSGRQLVPPLPHRHQVWHAAWSDSGRWVATITRDGFVRLWDASTGEPITPPLAHPGNPLAVRFLDEGWKLCALNAEGVLRIWGIQPESRPASELALLAELLAARQPGADESSMRAVSPERLKQAWDRLRHRYPESFGWGQP
jgi:eukaryotic-like serine/threonine-protein kinase